MGGRLQAVDSFKLVDKLQAVRHTLTCARLSRLLSWARIRCTARHLSLFPQPRRNVMPDSGVVIGDENLHELEGAAHGPEPPPKRPSHARSSSGIPEGSQRREQRDIQRASSNSRPMSATSQPMSAASSRTEYLRPTSASYRSLQRPPSRYTAIDRDNCRNINHGKSIVYRPNSANPETARRNSRLQSVYASR